jgi:hypothetical protein
MSSYLMSVGLVVMLYNDWDSEVSFIKWKTYCTAKVNAQQLEEEKIYGRGETRLRIYACTRQIEANGVR